MKLVLAISVAALLCACTVATARDSAPTVTLQIGEPVGTAIYDAVEAAAPCAEGQSMHLALMSTPPGRVLRSGLRWEPVQDGTTRMHLSGIPMRADSWTADVTRHCERADGAHVRGYQNVRLRIVVDARYEHRVPEHVRHPRSGYDYYHFDAPHPTHAAEIDLLETRVAETEARSFAQATQLADIEATVEVDVTAIARLRADSTSYGSRLVGLEATAEAVSSLTDKVNGNQRWINTHSHD